jgi:predicted DNA-binding protein
MSKELHEAFNSVSSNSMVPKSTLARLAITSLLKDVRDKGIQVTIKDIRER